MLLFSLYLRRPSSANPEAELVILLTPGKPDAVFISRTRRPSLTLNPNLNLQRGLFNLMDMYLALFFFFFFGVTLTNNALC